ncbi:MAG TPA: DedA family protein [Anaeromyxobacter sp.]|nr:DedA family protein [Anaeromyxobacter sp.]
MPTLQSLTARLADLVSRTGQAAPAVLFFATFVEHVFPPFPGDFLVVLGSWYAVHGAISWPLALAVLTLGAVAGAWVDHALGRSLGRRIDRGAARRGPLTVERLARFEATYRRYGVGILLANRFLPGIRAFIFLAAGASRIPLGTTLLFGGLSALAWNALLLAAGAFVARSVDELVLLFDRYTAVAWVVLALAGLVVLVIALRRRRAARAAPEGR